MIKKLDNDITQNEFHGLHFQTFNLGAHNNVAFRFMGKIALFQILLSFYSLGLRNLSKLRRHIKKLLQEVTNTIFLR